MIPGRGVKDWEGTVVLSEGQERGSKTWNEKSGTVLGSAFFLDLDLAL